MSSSELRGAFLFNGLVDFKNGVTNGADCFHCHGGELAQQQNLNMGGLANNGLDAVHTSRSQDRADRNIKFRLIRTVCFAGDFQTDQTGFYDI